MVLSKRERSIAIGLGGLVAVVVLWLWVFQPLVDWSAKIDKDKEAALLKQKNDEQLKNDQAKLQKVWDEMQKSGIFDNPSDAQNQLSQALSDWAVQSGVSVVSDAPGQAQTVDPKFGFVQAGRQMRCVGTTSGIAKLLYQIEVAKIPARVHNVTISSRKEGQDDLTAQLDVTTLCVVPPAPGKAAAPAQTPTAMRSEP